MTTKTSSPEGVLLRFAAISLAVGVAVVACVGDLTELYPPDGGYPEFGTPGSDAGGGGGDMAMPAGDPKFFPDIQADVQALGCTAMGCHAAGQQPILIANPASQTDKDANYDNFAMRSMDGANSLVLTKNLATSGVTHSVKPFASTSDPIYTKWLNWINAGRVKQ